MFLEIFNLLQIKLLIAIIVIDVLKANSNTNIINNKSEIEVVILINSNNIANKVITIGVKIPQPITGNILLLAIRLLVDFTNLGANNKLNPQITKTITSKLPKEIK